MSENEEKIEPEEQETEKTEEQEEERETGQPEGFAKKIKPETKTALIAAGLSLISIIALYLVAYSNQITDCNLILGGIVGGIVVGGIFGVIIGGIVGGIFGGIFGGIIGGGVGGGVGGIFGVIIGGIFGGIVGGIVGSGKKQVSGWIILPLTIVFLLPFITVMVPLSKYHNLRQIEHDKKTVEMLEISTEKDKIMITLPYEHCEEHSYLEKVLFIRGEDKKTAWKDIAVPCRKGNEYWYEATFDIALFTNRSLVDDAALTLFFDHAWEDYETTKEIFLPDPNSL